MTRPKDFDPQAIPHYNADGRIGELDPDEPEERQSSAQSESGTEPLASEQEDRAPPAATSSTDAPKSDTPKTDTSAPRDGRR